jgi:putative nucleotidyltransferase with HDIG domain
VPDKKPNILVIDDEACVRHSLKFILKDEYNVLTAPGAIEGQFYLSVNPVDIVLLDIRLRGTDGLQLLRDIKNRFPHIEIIMITAYASVETIREAIRFGAYDYLIKPFDKNELLSVVKKALIQRKGTLSIKNELDLLRESTMYLEHLIKNAKNLVIESSENSMIAMLHNINSRDGYTWSHVRRVTSLSSRIAEKMRMTEEEIQWLKCSALLHDVGKVKIDSDILEKEGKLTAHEYSLVKMHPDEGAKIVKSIPFLKNIIPSIKHHHERYDGSGYPDGLQGEDIPFKARVLAVADAVDSMINSPVRPRPYLRDRVERELRLHAGKQFDPGIVKIVIKDELLSFT